MGASRELMKALDAIAKTDFAPVCPPVQWTREPPKESGWYWVRSGGQTSPVYWCGYPDDYRSQCNILFDLWLWWPVPLVLPPKPEGV
jgi:hypothetical protein